jgi:hypothetical protein
VQGKGFGVDATAVCYDHPFMKWILVFASLLLNILAWAEDTAPPRPKPESFIMLPEPREMRSSQSLMLPDAKQTVFTAAREISDQPGVRTYSDEEFGKLGISLETFLQRARVAAEKRIALLKPEYIKDAEGRLRYAVYRSESPLNASLILAPSLGTLFQKILGEPIWAVLPDRNTLYLFPARPDALAEFTSDLRDRYDADPFAASSEIFVIKPGGGLPRVVGSFRD